MWEIKTLRATSLLLGTIVGAGLFALPAVTSRAGFFVTAFWLVLLVVIVTLIHAMYGDIALATSGRHRLPGYAKAYLGQGAARLAFVSSIVGGVGVLLVYLILAERFIAGLVPQASQDSLGVVVWLFLVIPITFGIKTIARFELVLAALLIILLVGIGLVLAPQIDMRFLSGGGTLRDAVLPYGALLFALWGANAVPEMRDFFAEKTRNFRRAIVFGTLASGALYAWFITAVVGAFGERARLEDVGTLLAGIGAWTQWLVVLLAVIAIATSFFVLGAYLVDTLRFDLKIGRIIAMLSLAIPLVLFLAGARDSISIISFIGTVLGAVDGTLIVLMWRKARMRATRETPILMLPRGLAYGMMVLFLGGAIVEIVTLTAHAL